MTYALEFLWHERQRYRAAVLAVAFSALLVSVQYGLLWGMLSFATLPIDHSRADIWVGGPALTSIDEGTLIPERFLTRVAVNPEVERCEVYVQAFAIWSRRDGGSELCMVIGSRLEEEALGALTQLTPELRSRLTEPGSVAIDEADRGRLGVTDLNEVGEIGDRRVRVVGMVQGARALLGPRVFCSIGTARRILELPAEQTNFVLARCRTPADAARVVRRLRAAYPELSTYTSAEFAARTRLHWVTRTKAGLALSISAMLGLLVGAVVISQTLSAAVLAEQREYALLRALGIPRWRLGSLILAESFWVGLIGTFLALPVAFVLSWGAALVGLKVMLPAWLLATTFGVTFLMALASSLSALRVIRRLEPFVLLH